jgi:CPA2 family monovalent cation:H+ antiporter-2
LIESPGLVAAALAVILLGKPLAALGIVLLLKYPLRVAVSVAVALAQIGEFSFILAAAGKNLGILDDRATNTLVAAAIVSVMLNPVLYRLIGPLEAALRHFVRTPVPVDMVMQSKELDEQGESGRYKAVVVGYGPVGRTLARLLRENEFALVIIELNADTVRELTSRGIRAR